MKDRIDTILRSRSSTVTLLLALVVSLASGPVGCVATEAYDAAGVHASAMDGYVADLEAGELDQVDAELAVVASWVLAAQVDLYLNDEPLEDLQAEAIDRLQQGEAGREVFRDVRRRILGVEEEGP